MENLSGLKPLGVAVLVEPYEPERKGGKIVIPANVQERTSMVDQRVTVIEVGPSAWHDEPAPRAKAGDKVLVTKFAGMLAIGTKDGKQYRLVNDRDVFCAIVDEEPRHE
jgi:co-chaperonin GroES (HSP10)